MNECRLCGCQLYLDGFGAPIDVRGSDVCGQDSSGGPHQLDDADDELMGLAVLDVTGITDHVPGMPDVL